MYTLISDLKQAIIGLTITAYSIKTRKVWSQMSWHLLQRLVYVFFDHICERTALISAVCISTASLLMSQKWPIDSRTTLRADGTSNHWSAYHFHIICLAWNPKAIENKMTNKCIIIILFRTLDLLSIFRIAIFVSCWLKDHSPLKKHQHNANKDSTYFDHFRVDIGKQDHIFTLFLT